MNNTNFQIRQPIEQKNFVDRRKSPRFDSSAIPFLKSVHQVEGPEIKLINISRTGALIETQERITPESDIFLRLVTAETVYILKGRILRCYVYKIDSVLKYQGAIAFDKDFMILPSYKELFR